MALYGIAQYGESEYALLVTLKDIRQRVGSAQFAGDTVVSTASAVGTTLTLIDTTVKQPNDFYNYGTLAIVSGALSGAVRYITDWVQSTSTYTVDRSFGGSPAQGVSYEAHRLFPFADKNNAINAAILASGSRWCRKIDDAVSVTLDDNTYTYNLSTLLVVSPDPNLLIDWIGYDTGANPTGYEFKKIDNAFWTIRNVDGALILQFAPETYLRDGAALRVIYRVRPPVLSADTDTLYPDDTSFYNYVCAKAAAILFRDKSLREEGGLWEARAKEFDQLAEGFYDVERPAKPPKEIRMPAWGDTAPYPNATRIWG